jgi:hypothetical protein
MRAWAANGAVPTGSQVGARLGTASKALRSCRMPEPRLIRTNALAWSGVRNFIARSLETRVAEFIKNATLQSVKGQKPKSNRVSECAAASTLTGCPTEPSGGAIFTGVALARFGVNPGPPMTLGNAAAARVRLIVWCNGCQRQVEPDPAEMAQRYGAETHKIFLKCEVSHNRRADTSR